MDRSKKLMLNIVTSVLMQGVSLVCAFILPRLILKQYGSEVNGLVNSISQFLSVISFLELGVGAVIKSALYKPLAEKNNEKLSKILASGGRFFRNIAFVLTGYVILLICFYPFAVREDFDWIYTVLLIGSMSISYFAQYYFGIIDRLLLSSDQRGYIQYSIQIFTLIANTAVCFVLIRQNASVQLVKFASSIIFLVKPIVMRAYIKKHYDIDRKIAVDKEPIEQKWNGVAQHIAAFVLNGTDTIVLTLFSTLSNVSIYSVYHMVLSGINKVFMSSAGGVQSLLGEMIAKEENDELNEFFSLIEFAMHTAITLIFTCTAVLIIPFVRVYTSEINDADYIQPLFSVLIVCANAGYCLRLPYHLLILAGGHYKQTQSNYIVAALINIIISVSTVYFWGLEGVAVGTLAAMVYQIIWMAVYDSRNIVKRPIKKFVRQCLVDLIDAGLIILAVNHIQLTSLTYLSWAVMAVKVTFIAGIIVAAVSLLFYKDTIKIIIKKIMHRH